MIRSASESQAFSDTFSFSRTWRATAAGPPAAAGATGLELAPLHVLVVNVLRRAIEAAGSPLTQAVAEAAAVDALSALKALASDGPAAHGGVILACASRRLD